MGLCRRRIATCACRAQTVFLISRSKRFLTIVVVFSLGGGRYGVRWTLCFSMYILPPHQIRAIRTFNVTFCDN